jgi:hypothetical protein
MERFRLGLVVAAIVLGAQWRAHATPLDEMAFREARTATRRALADWDRTDRAGFAIRARRLGNREIHSNFVLQRGVRTPGSPDAKVFVSFSRPNKSLGLAEYGYARDPEIAVTHHVHKVGSKGAFRLQAVQTYLGAGSTGIVDHSTLRVEPLFVPAPGAKKR